MSWIFNSACACKDNDHSGSHNQPAADLHSDDIVINEKHYNCPPAYLQSFKLCMFSEKAQMRLLALWTASISLAQKSLWLPAHTVAPAIPAHLQSLNRSLHDPFKRH